MSPSCLCLINNQGWEFQHLKFPQTPKFPQHRHQQSQMSYNHSQYYKFTQFWNQAPINMVFVSTIYMVSTVSFLLYDSMLINIKSFPTLQKLKLPLQCCQWPTSLFLAVHVTGYSTMPNTCTYTKSLVFISLYQFQ